MKGWAFSHQPTANLAGFVDRQRVVNSATGRRLDGLCEVRMVVDWDLIDPRIHPYVLYTFAMTFLTIVGVLLGGISGSSKKAAASESCS
jgi:hypothetical protein